MHTSEEILQATIDVILQDTGLTWITFRHDPTKPLYRDFTAALAKEAGADTDKIGEAFGMTVEDVDAITKEVRMLPAAAQSLFFQLLANVLDRLENTSKVGPK